MENGAIVEDTIEPSKEGEVNYGLLTNLREFPARKFTKLLFS